MVYDEECLCDLVCFEDFVDWPFTLSCWREVFGFEEEPTLFVPRRDACSCEVVRDVVKPRGIRGSWLSVLCSFFLGGCWWSAFFGGVSFLFFRYVLRKDGLDCVGLFRPFGWVVGVYNAKTLTWQEVANNAPAIVGSELRFAMCALDPCLPREPRAVLDDGLDVAPEHLPTPQWTANAIWGRIRVCLRMPGSSYRSSSGYSGGP